LKEGFKVIFLMRKGSLAPFKCRITIDEYVKVDQ
jgi:hypothetical protein